MFTIFKKYLVVTTSKKLKFTNISNINSIFHGCSYGNFFITMIGTATNIVAKLAAATTIFTTTKTTTITMNAAVIVVTEEETFEIFESVTATRIVHVHDRTNPKF